jgi:hypothetical protein
MNRFLSVLLLLLFTGINLYSIDSDVTFGYQYKKTDNFNHAEFYIRLNVWQDIGGLRLYGGIENEFSYIDKLMFAPRQDYYIIGASYAFDFVRLKLEHSCYHPVTTWGITNGINGGYTKFEVMLCLP